MDKLSRDRFIIVIITIASCGLTIESIMAGWEFWMPVLLVMGMIALWLAYITQKMEETYREIFYLCFGLIASFFHGMHDTSFFDVAIISALMLITFSLLDKIYMLDLILV